MNTILLGIITYIGIGVYITKCILDYEEEDVKLKEIHIFCIMVILWPIAGVIFVDKKYGNKVLYQGKNKGKKK